MGIGGMAVGFILIIALAVVIGSFIERGSSGTALTTYHANASGRIDTLPAGTCLSARPSLVDVSARDQTVPCSELHGSEMIGLVTLPDLIERPSPRAFDEFVHGACGLQLRDYVGSSTAETGLAFGGVVPDDDAWKENGREVWCLVDSSGFEGGIGSVESSGA